MPPTTITQNKQFQEIRDSLFGVLSREKVLIALTIVPALSLFGFIIVVPALWTVYASFHEIPIFSPEWSWVGLTHYGTILSSPEFWESMYRSFLFAAGSVSLQLVAGTALALALNRSFRFIGLIRAIAMLPYLIPTAVLGFIGLWMGNSQWGIINEILINTGLLSEPIAWYGNLDLAMIAVVLTSSWKFTIFVTIMVLARLQSIPDGYYEAAKMAGATTYQRFRDITLPNLKGVIFIVLLLRGIWMFNKFDIIWVLTSGGPGDATRTAPIYAYEIAFNSSALGRSAAASTLLFIMLLIGALLYFHYLSPEDEVRVE